MYKNNGKLPKKSLKFFSKNIEKPLDKAKKRGIISVKVKTFTPCLKIT